MTNKLAQSLAYLRWNKLTPEEKREQTAKARAARANAAKVRNWSKKPPKTIAQIDCSEITDCPISLIMSRRDIDKETGCWNYTGTLNGNGYGQLAVEKSLFLVHRLSFTHFRGAIPKGMVLDHLCRNPRCFNPKHLEAVSLAENSRRAKSSKLDQRKAENIRARYAVGNITMQSLADEFGVTKQCISLVVNKQAWF